MDRKEHPVLSRIPSAVFLGVILWIVATGAVTSELTHNVQDFLNHPTISRSIVKQEHTIVLDGVYFSPRGGGEEAIVQEIDKATKSLYILAYSFTSDPIISAVVRAQKRGLTVGVVLDKTHMKEKNGAAARFKAAGIQTLIDDRHAIAHNKFMILDGTHVITGSYNFTKSASERNAENLLLLTDTPLATTYTENFNNHRSHSKPYTGSEKELEVPSESADTQE